MSHYLVERINAQPNIEVLTRTKVTALEGRDGDLERVRWRDRASGEERLHPIRHLFLFIGADPNTDWLAKCGVTLDAKGFIRIGDVRSGSVKRVAAAVGEGAQVVAALHAYLARTTVTPSRLSEELDAERVQARGGHTGCHPERARLRGMPENRLALGAFASMPYCGHVGCCDDLPNWHATKHFHKTGHPISRATIRRTVRVGAMSTRS